jgi:hypothetical protein
MATNFLDALLEEETEQLHPFIFSLIEKIAKTNQITTTAHDWSYILCRVWELLSVSERWAQFSVVYIALARNRSLQDYVRSTLADPTLLEFFNTEWFPYLQKMTELLRLYDTGNPMLALHTYSMSLRETWFMRKVLLLPTNTAVEAVKPISLIQFDSDPSLQPELTANLGPGTGP